VLLYIKVDLSRVICLVQHCNIAIVLMSAYF